MFFMREPEALGIATSAMNSLLQDRTTRGSQSLAAAMKLEAHVRVTCSFEGRETWKLSYPSQGVQC